ncbi:MAG TPA: lysophospholipid acyltransferase family protein [Gemmatimonadaceae bacterium]|nr:lysophospholipid acyltransferase family protein [Gemmatimonadaceae bacterium]
MRRVTVADRVEYIAVRVAMGVLARLPFPRASAVGGWLGALGYAPFGIRRRVVERQIAAAFPELDRDEVRRLSKASYRHLGRVATEAALLPRLDRAQLLALVERVDGWELVENALHQGDGSGLIFVTGHLGNWELSAAYAAARGVPMDVVVRRLRNRLVDRFINANRLRAGLAVVYAREAVRRATRSLRIGRAVGFLADQSLLNLASTYVPFFGRPAKTPRGPAVFALRWNVPMLFGVALRQPNGRYRLSFEPIAVRDTGDREADVDRVVDDYTRVLERWVRSAPEQYFWHHRRWKRQPPDTPPELRDPVLHESRTR